MEARDFKQRLKAAESLLAQKTTSRTKFEAARKLISGINPTLDAKLKRVAKVLATVEKIKKGKVIELAAERLSAGTPEQKKRKKKLLLLINAWKDLKAEVGRVRSEFEKPDAKGMAQLAAYAKGPLGLVTAAAAVVVGAGWWLSQNAAEVELVNRGCDPIQPAVSRTLNLPGLRLPSQPIGDGESAVALVPPLKVAVEGGERQVGLSIYGLKMGFELAEGASDVKYDGQSLLNQTNVIKLAPGSRHQVELECD
ncbi:MAG: hypothetical protein UX85_C0004G0187 [Candidatus Beckwithbacteria bacterium GW2011_GWB1_47_15]|uniref:Uncharacterized protein n=1 Tax=Candidatus Beckwithbacteria bacterium GW2011_GWB1_47_15 TaxID=1618371 RepID=A0A0G1UU70_9BACT|nr:MAG: hypothetical protein UY43_C0001G0048 [Candidatus Beckwithbacteria bacterium GW2011_GWC1_49_16]KKU34990.1 MAG: hypothetical protein UX50_C0007G0025 [Candidatus Beckwithbacteria bacterium GW2011_GWA1_46_30]KKU61265.1 MAG: hypothetical protein UX85_C0004G0187 [Candidatus Beckwithbacteria bacterium GW2011_GWB1_47_15]KKU71441.1 MAG: hypothetical protein UX97_C0006G0025 [Candidatus Beckwithbacteria bacterium GW2011_GWA2_47_25]KKW03071.1 MAG: hypothetical protein UY37_C0007G0025 [Candidatus Be